MLYSFFFNKVYFFYFHEENRNVMPFLLKIIKSFSQAKIKCYTIFAILMLNSVINSELTTANMNLL